MGLKSITIDNKKSDPIGSLFLLVPFCHCEEQSNRTLQGLLLSSLRLLRPSQ